MLTCGIHSDWHLFRRFTIHLTHAVLGSFVVVVVVDNHSKTVVMSDWLPPAAEPHSTPVEYWLMIIQQGSPRLFGNPTLGATWDQFSGF